MTEREKLLAKAFDTVMGAAGMPHETDPDYELWLFNAFITALEAADVRLVPVEASREMLLKAGASPDGVSPRGGTDYLGKMLPKYYAAMLAASPYTPEGTRND